ncbi:hypothetical protein ACFU7T_16215 [Streptomyces sp. NPDC057555]|uniref:hypothetical protein n=1 Tax=Streptomyces sp. NPDC057555 TaxID=3346166 RepID=UPI00369749B9
MAAEEEDRAADEAAGALWSLELALAAGKMAFPGLDRQPDAAREGFKARNGWMDELTDAEVDEIQRALDACLDAVQGAGGEEAPERPVEGMP